MPISQDLRPISQDLQRDSAQEGPGESDNGDPIMGLFFVGSCKSSYDLVTVKETGSRNRIRCVDSENKSILLPNQGLLPLIVFALNHVQPTSPLTGTSGYRVRQSRGCHFC